MQKFAETFTHYEDAPGSNSQTSDFGKSSTSIADGEFYLEGNVTDYMTLRYVAYGAWMTSAWSGVPMIFLNDNSVAVTNEAGTMPNWGLLTWGLLGSGWPFVFFVVLWYEMFFPNTMAILTLEGYGQNRVSKIDPDAKKRLMQRA